MFLRSDPLVVCVTVSSAAFESILDIVRYAMQFPQCSFRNAVSVPCFENVLSLGWVFVLFCFFLGWQMQFWWPKHSLYRTLWKHKGKYPELVAFLVCSDVIAPLATRERVGTKIYWKHSRFLILTSAQESSAKVALCYKDLLEVEDLASAPSLADVRARFGSDSRVLLMLSMILMDLLELMCNPWSTGLHLEEPEIGVVADVYTKFRDLAQVYFYITVAGLASVDVAHFMETQVPAYLSKFACQVHGTMCSTLDLQGCCAARMEYRFMKALCCMHSFTDALLATDDTAVTMRLHEIGRGHGPGCVCPSLFE